MFSNISSESAPTEVESLCVQCKENGVTTMLLTTIPGFREVILVSFSCPHCGNRNNEVQFGGSLASKGIEITFKVKRAEDVNRELVRSGFAMIKVDQLALEIPANGKGEVNTIEGLLLNVASDLALNQPLRKIEDPEQWQQLEEFIGRIHKCLEQGDFTLRIRDPSGNSYLKNPFAPKMDPALKVVGFVRSREELEQMGYSVENAEEEQKHLAHRIDFTAPFDERRLLREDGVQFEVNCHSCGLSGNLRMCETNIPFFKDLLIMAFTCEYCGAHSTETKTSGEVPPFARKITLSVSLATAQADLRRDLFKSDTCGVRIPELDLELTYGTLGGVYTTVEGLLEKIYEHLSGICSFTDSDEDYAARMKQLLSDLAALREGCKEFVLELDDPLGFSFLQNPCHPDKDPNTLVESYQRSFEQNEDLGFNDIKV